MTLLRHKLPALLDTGLRVAVSCDDPAQFGAYVDENFMQTFATQPQPVARHAW